MFYNFDEYISYDTLMQESSKRIFPLCESYLLINQFVESRSQFKTGLVNHAFASALRALLLVGVWCCKLYIFCFRVVLALSFLPHIWFILQSLFQYLDIKLSCTHMCLSFLLNQCKCVLDQTRESNVLIRENHKSEMDTWDDELIMYLDIKQSRVTYKHMLKLLIVLIGGWILSN